MRSVSIKKQPDGEDREWLAEVKGDGKNGHPTGQLDAAYFPTKKAAEEWARIVYGL